MSGTAGGVPGTGGGFPRPLLRAYAAIAAFVALVDTVNVLTALHDAARRGEALAAWEPVTWEVTSGTAELIASPIIYFAVRFAPWTGRRWPAALPVHAGASLAFSAVHVTLMMALRIAIYGALGFHYRVEAGALPYEYRKDLLAYIVLAGAFHVIAKRRSATAAAEPSVVRSPAPGAAPTLDVSNNGRRRTLAPDEIVALKAAGNYVEVLTADGRRHLIRRTLTDLETQLAGAGLVRTHRSWLANPRHVLQVRPNGSGDHIATLRGDVAVPVSRRFSSAVSQLAEVTEDG